MIHLQKLIKKALSLNNWFVFYSAIALVVGSSAITRLIEPETFPTFFEALWWVMTTVTTVGYGDYSPVTTGGRVFAIILYMIGIGYISLVIGKIIEGFSAVKKRREEGRMEYKGKNHIIIIGWSKKASFAVKEIMETENNREIVIIDKLEKAPLLTEDIHYIKGDAAEEKTLLKANIKEAEAVLIFSDDSIHDALLADGKSLLICTTIESMVPEIHTTVEVMKEEHIKNFKHVKVDEFVLTHETISRLAVRSIFSKGITNVFSQLMSRGHGEDLYEVVAKPHWKTYRQAFDELLQEGATLISDGNNLEINRNLDENISPNARLFVICDRETYLKIKT
ncbi:potassium channel family protein [Pseudalkalibacillus caeni]|uniref:Potassium channel family protein n=2 Tax=Exobacillus caeni TaxID=2574798 RepID=A0A5R9FB35_9BACL|nr:potassium channel family protein [Pseudalkalibacillus caeni]